MKRTATIGLVLSVLFVAVPDAGAAQEPGARQAATHTVRQGETLGDIARQYYGSAADWRRIFEANRQRIANPDRLSVGWELVIPGVGPAGGPGIAARGIRVEEARPQVPTDPVARRALLQRRPLRPGPTSVPPAERTIFHSVPVAPDALGQVVLMPADLLPALPSGLFHAAGWLVRPGEPLDRRGRIVAHTAGAVAPERTLILPHEDVRIEVEPGVQLEPGDRFLTARINRRVEDVGEILTPTGVLEVRRVDAGGAVARLVRDFGSTQLHDDLFDERTFPLREGVYPAETEDRLAARILAFEELKELYLPGDRLFIGLGAEDGIAVGDVFDAFVGTGNGWTGRHAASFQVVGVRDRTATLRILANEAPKDVQTGLTIVLSRRMP